jgi:hypothetical protein
VKKIFRLIVLVVSILYCGITYGQNIYINLTSSDLIKGLDNKDFLREKLAANGFKITGKNLIGTVSNAFYESWQYESSLFVDIIYNPGKENIIKVGVHENYKGFPERLIRSFPKKSTVHRDDPLTDVNVSPINKTVSYALEYVRDNYKARVIVWYDYPYYFFEFTDEKRR